MPYLIRDDGVGMEDSQLICIWLDRLDGSPRFDHPAGQERWESRRLEALARSLMDGLSVWGRNIVLSESERSETMIAHERQRSRRLFDLLESQIGHPLLTGELNLVQITLVCALQLERRNPDIQWRQARPESSKWMDKINVRTSIIETLPPFIQI